MYKIIGADQKEYGPVTADQINAWILEGRANGQTQVQPEGSADWRPLSTFPEFAGVFAAKPSTNTLLPPHVFTRDYNFDIGVCISRAWELVKNNFGLVLGASAIFMAIQIGLSVMGQIPILGIVISMGSLVIGGPLMGGVYYFLLKLIRAQPAEIGDIFAGFRLCFVQLMLGHIVTTLLAGISAIPGAVIVGFALIPVLRSHQLEAASAAIVAVGAVIMMIPLVFLYVTWIFSLPLIIDKQVDFWTGMEASRKTVWKHWWKLFGLLLVGGLLTAAGVLVCCVGALVTLPIALGAIMYGYETIFGAGPTPPA